jgi:hypothetical protein
MPLSNDGLPGPHNHEKDSDNDQKERLKPQGADLGVESPYEVNDLKGQEKCDHCADDPSSYPNRQRIEETDLGWRQGTTP